MCYLQAIVICHSRQYGPPGRPDPHFYSYFFLIMVIVEDDVRLIRKRSPPLEVLKHFLLVYVSNDVRPKYLEVSVKGKMAPPMLKQRKPEMWSTHHYKKYR